MDIITIVLTCLSFSLTLLALVTSIRTADRVTKLTDHYIALAKMAHVFMSAGAEEVRKENQDFFREVEKITGLDKRKKPEPPKLS